MFSKASDTFTPLSWSYYQGWECWKVQNSSIGVSAFGKELSITREQCSLISARCKIHTEGKSCILYFTAPDFPPSSSLQRLDQCSMLSAGERAAWLVFPPKLIQGHGLIWERTSSLKLWTSYLGNPLLVTSCMCRWRILKSLGGIILAISPFQKWMYSGQLETGEVITLKYGFVSRWNFLNS